MRFIFFIVIASLFFIGCPPKTASLLIDNDSANNIDEWRYFTTNEGDFFQVANTFVVDTLNQRLTHPIIATIRIDLLNDTNFQSSRVQLSSDSLYYYEDKFEKSIELSEIFKITIVEKYTANDFWYNSGYGTLYGAAFAVLPASSRDSFREAGKSALIGAGVGIIALNLLGYRSKKVYTPQTIFINGIKRYSF